MTKSKNKEVALTYVDLIAGAPIPHKNFYILSGSDPFAFVESEKIFIKKFIPDDPSRMNLHRFDCDANTKALPVINICEEYPFGSQYKLVILQNAQNLSGKEGEKINRYLENPSETAILIIMELETEKKGASEGKFHPLRDLKGPLKRFGLHIPCKLSFAQIKGWIQNRFEAEGKKIDREALDTLINMVGIEDLWELHQEIIKISLFCGKKETVKESDVKAITSHRPQSKIFNLSEQAGLKNISGSLVILNDLLREKIAGVQILTAVSNHFRFLFRIKKLLDEGKNEEEAAHILHRHPYYVKKSAIQARKFTERGFEKIFDLIARADGGMKSGMDERTVLELTLIQICR